MARRDRAAHAGSGGAPLRALGAELLDELDPPRLPCAPQAAPERFETGTQSHEDMAGVSATVEFLAGRAYTVLHARSELLLERMWHGGLVRAGCASCTAEEEVDRLISAVEGAATS